MAFSTRYSLNKSKYLLAPEADHLEALLDRFITTHLRDCTLLLLALKTGARAQELLQIRKMDLNFYEKTVYIRGIKGSSDREIPLTHKLFQSLAKIAELSATKDTDLIFPISYNRLRQIWQFYRPVNKKLHCLRHTFAIRLYQKTKDIRLVQVALGHRNIANTMIYADYLYSQQELRRLIL